MADIFAILQALSNNRSTVPDAADILQQLQLPESPNLGRSGTAAISAPPSYNPYEDFAKTPTKYFKESPEFAQLLKMMIDGKGVLPPTAGPNISKALLYRQTPEGLPASKRDLRKLRRERLREARKNPLTTRTKISIERAGIPGTEENLSLTQAYENHMNTIKESQLNEDRVKARLSAIQAAQPDPGRRFQTLPIQGAGVSVPRIDVANPKPPDFSPLAFAGGAGLFTEPELRIQKDLLEAGPEMERKQLDLQRQIAKDTTDAWQKGIELGLRRDEFNQRSDEFGKNQKMKDKELSLNRSKYIQDRTKDLIAGKVPTGLAQFIANTEANSDPSTLHQDLAYITASGLANSLQDKNQNAEEILGRLKGMVSLLEKKDDLPKDVRKSIESSLSFVSEQYVGRLVDGEIVGNGALQQSITGRMDLMNLLQSNVDPSLWANPEVSKGLILGLQNFKEKSPTTSKPPEEVPPLFGNLFSGAGKEFSAIERNIGQAGTEIGGSIRSVLGTLPKTKEQFQQLYPNLDVPYNWENMSDKEKSRSLMEMSRRYREKGQTPSEDNPVFLEYYNKEKKKRSFRTIKDMGSAKIGSLVNEIAQKYEIDPKVLASLTKVESRFNTKAVSPKGARGMTQVMPATAAEMFKNNPSLPSPDLIGISPRADLEYGAAYLKEQLDRFGGNLPLALAAYNAGPGAVAEYKNTVPPYRETQDYVSKIMKDLGL